MKPFTPAFVPEQHQISSMEAFRQAVLNFETAKLYYQDDLSHLADKDGEWWHQQFNEYHDVSLTNAYVAVACVTNGSYINDLQYVPIERGTIILLML